MKKLLLLLLCVPMIVFGQNWNQLGNDIDGEAANDESGRSVSLSSDGNIMAIGASKNDGNGADAGHVRVYENVGGTWSQIGQDIDGEAVGDLSGHSVALSSDGTIVAFGEKGYDGKGRVRVFKYNGSSWSLLGGATDMVGDSGDEAGTSVTISYDGTIVAIGAPEYNIGGRVRVYKYNGRSEEHTSELQSQ